MTTAFAPRPLRGRVELPVQWEVNPDGSVSFQVFHFVFRSILVTNALLGSSHANSFCCYCIQVNNPSAFSFTSLGIPDIIIIPLPQSPCSCQPGSSPYALLMHDLGIGVSSLTTASSITTASFLTTEFYNYHIYIKATTRQSWGSIYSPPHLLVHLFLFPSYISQLNPAPPSPVIPYIYTHTITLHPFIFLIIANIFIHCDYQKPYLTFGVAL